jgi:hypothetical protein
MGQEIGGANMEKIKEEIIDEVKEEIKTMYVLLNEENRICMVTKDKQREEQFEFAFPSDFDFSGIANWKIVDGELVYDELIIPTPEPKPTPEERIAELEAQNTMLMECVLEMSEIIYA